MSIDYSRECSILPIPLHIVSKYYQDKSGEHGIRLFSYGTDNSWMREGKKTHLHLIWEDVKDQDQDQHPESEDQQLFLIHRHDFKKANNSQYERLDILKTIRSRYETAFVENDRRCTTSKILFDQITTGYNFGLQSETQWGELYDKKIKKLWEKL